MKFRRASVMLMAAFFALPFAAQALQAPRPIATDSRIRTVRYSYRER